MGCFSHRPTTQAFLPTLRADPCSYCNGAGGTVDHIFPRSLKIKLVGVTGVNSWANLTGACLTCNQKRANIGLLRFLLNLHNGYKMLRPDATGNYPSNGK